LEELLASNVAPTAKVRAASELLDRLEPLLGRTSKEAAIRQAKQELADEFDAATVGARAKLESLLASRAAGVGAPGGKPAGSEAWADDVRRALAELDRVMVDRSGAEPVVRLVEVDPVPIIEGLIERGLLGLPAEWARFQAHVEERARELTVEAERRAVEAEAKLAEFTSA
jgi:hypothetical protein